MQVHAGVNVQAGTYLSIRSVNNTVKLASSASPFKWAIAVKIRYPPVDDTVLGNGNTIGNPHSLSYRVWVIQTKIVKLATENPLKSLRNISYYRKSREKRRK